MDELINDLFSLESPEHEVESTHQITPRSIRLERKRKHQLRMREDNAERILGDLPKPGEAIHIVSDGKFDYWNFVPVILKKADRPASEAYFSTWTTNRTCVGQLLELIDSGAIKKAAYLTGLYFKRRETSVYATLLAGLTKRGMRMIAMENHAKVVLLAIEPDYYVMEGSANFTSNPRIEQNIITNDQELYNFHHEWFDEVFSASGTV